VSDTVEPDVTSKMKPEADLERTAEASSVLPPDPFNIRGGLLTDEQITELRCRQKGKRVAKFHQRQNDVKYCV